MNHKKRIEFGDIFRFTSGLSEYGCGQIIKSNILQYIIVFEPIFGQEINLCEALMSPILLSGWTSDARFISGDWDIVGQASPPRNFPFPEYKVESAGQIWVTDNDGRHLRVADEAEVARLYFRGSHSPIAFEKAFWARHGRRPWESRFNGLLVATSN